MDAQGRGQAGDIDPADQWVFNPNTGSYELRLNAADDSPSQYGTQRPSAPRQRRSSARHESPSPAEPATDDDGQGPGGEPRLPSQRRARGNTKSGHAEGKGGGHGRRKAKSRMSGKKKALCWSCGGLGLLLIAGCVGGYAYYQRLNGNINKVDVGMNNDAVSDGPVNILVIGTDAREGKGNTGYGDNGSVGHADTTFLFHVSKDRSNATALSIPRDMITSIPNCPTKQKDGSTKSIPGQAQARFNTSLGQSERDPGCTWRTVEKLTGVKINHFMMADFNAVKELSTAVGGVEVCAGKDINDPKSHLKLKAGKHVVQGEQALAFVRTRHSVGFGSDLSRIGLQQQFLSAMIRKMKSGDTLTNPSKLFDLSDVATKALTVDTGIGSVKKLMSLANDLKRVNTKNITFTTVPVLDNPDDPATVVLDKAKAEPLFKMVRDDKSMTQVKKNQKRKAASQAKKAPASEVEVQVWNGGGPAGAARETAGWLLGEGAGKASVGDNAPQVKKTKLEYAPDQEGQAARVADMMGLPASALKRVAESPASDGGMKLTLGRDYSGAGEPITSPDKAPAGVKKVNADDKNMCAK
ncbi:LCP family protein [Streptomyces iconiensis]|uniref:LCP family protein n=1 Tax=Streptomyces iconiensis TaxID=1384038 RepID=A0ABT7AB29_9ACTN|nr:LCP family protein [Streptomyces iconiensis]MDJ1137818.1 LCP family protein [Streptomyces iconiensis]